MKKTLSITFIISLFAVYLLFTGFESKDIPVENVISATEIQLQNSDTVKISELKFFDPYFSSRNKILAKKLNITEEEAFIIGNLTQYWAENLLAGRKVKPLENDLIYRNFSYKSRFENSSFCLRNDKPTNPTAFQRQLKSIRRAKYVIFDLDKNIYYDLTEENAKKTNNFLVMRKSHVKKIMPATFKTMPQSNHIKSYPRPAFNFTYGNIKILVSDSTTKLKPDRQCHFDICKEILRGINSAQNSIDIAIYGYSSTPAIENALKSAKDRGVKIRLVYDADSKGGNIYPDTNLFAELIPNNRSDFHSKEVSATMHNKFYIFDDKYVITGSANLSHTDMSGFNSNAIIAINSPNVAKIYKQEFNQMYEGKFHSYKLSFQKESIPNMKIYFSPQDKTITYGILPLINSAQHYIYIPAFIITEKRVVTALIEAKNRGVDIKIIVDALNASNKYSKHNELRNAGIPVKAENYAGKMHSKTMIIDDEYLVIGSMNFSKNGELKNDENTIILKNPKAAKFYRDFFLYQWNRIPNRWLKFVPRAESLDSIGSCSDGIDNNYDGLIDSTDAACE